MNYELLPTPLDFRNKTDLQIVSTSKEMLTDLRAPLFDSKTSREDLLNLLDEKIGHTFAQLGSEINELEIKERDLVSPISPRVKWADRVDGLIDYFKTVDKLLTNLDSQSYDHAFKATRALIDPNSVRPISIDVAYSRSIKSTNWGLPYFEKGTTCSRKVLSLVKKSMISGDLDSIFRYPCVVGWRGQSSGVSIPKQRIVWMYPHTVSLIEKTFSDPLVKILSKHESFCAWNGLVDVDRRVTEQIMKYSKHGHGSKILLSVDYSGYDKNMNIKLINMAFSCIRTWFGVKYSSPINMIEDYFVNCSILTLDGMYTGSHGVPSGSGFTNFIDGIVNYFAYYYLCSRLGIQPSDVIVQGDDGVYSLLFNDYRFKNIDSLLNKVEDILSELGLKVNKKKQFLSFDLGEMSYVNGNVSDAIAVHFLQRLHVNSFMKDNRISGIRSIYRCFNGMIAYESLKNPQFNEVENSIRWIMQLENCKHHPRYHEFIEFIKSGDKLGLGTLYPGGVTNLFKQIDDNEKLLVKLGILQFRFKQEGVDVRGKFSLDTVRYLLQHTK